MDDVTTELLIERLRSDDPLDRRDAARDLGERRARVAVPALIDALRRPLPAGANESHPEHTSRAAAAVALGRIGDPAATAALLEASADPFNIGTAASTALGRLEPPPTRELIAATRDRNPWRRARAVMSLGEIRDGAAFDAMVPLLEDPEEIVQRAAAASFEKLRDPRAIAPLMRLLERDTASAFVRTYAAMALGALKAHDAVDLLMRLTDVPEANLRRAAARALCRIDDPRSRGMLERLASGDPDRSVRDVVSRYLSPREGQRPH